METLLISTFSTVRQLRRQALCELCLTFGVLLSLYLFTNYDFYVV